MSTCEVAYKAFNKQQDKDNRQPQQPQPQNALRGRGDGGQQGGRQK